MGPRIRLPPRTREVKQLAEVRMIAYAETSPEAVIRYHTVADGHRDEPALRILADLLNGRTGRLYQSLVLEQAVANSVSAGNNGYKYEGYFEFSGVAKPGKTPEDVEASIYREIERASKGTGWRTGIAKSKKPECRHRFPSVGKQLSADVSVAGL